MNLNLPADFFPSIFASHSAQMSVTLEHAIVSQAHGMAVVSVPNLDIEQFEEMGLCTIELQPRPRPILSRYWGGEKHDRLFDDYDQALQKVCWNGAELYLLEAYWQTAFGGSGRTWVIAEESEIADAFILDVERNTNDPGKAILVFRDGRWTRSRQLYETVQRSSFDDLILDCSLKQSIRADFSQFLSNRDRYASLGIPWRRGILLIGPPGNGKTHFVRALTKELAIPSLYVQSLRHPCSESEQLLRTVFERARRLRPCLLILEDLDSLINSRNQSFFLNQLDGFEGNDGLIVLATTNHADRIDPAIIDRPSRFDRKYHFELPEYEQRLSFLSFWRDRLASQVDWPPESVETSAQNSSGFSFAYLKELVVSGLMVWVDNQSEPFQEHIGLQLDLLASQMQTRKPSLKQS